MSTELESLYNTTVNENIIKATEGRPLLDPKLDNSISQLRKSMIETFEPSKLKNATSFRAICIAQLASIRVKDKQKIRIKARIPEIHTLLPLPQDSKDLLHIASYPTFVGDAENLKVPEGVDGIPEGSEVEVTFGNTNNFTQPKLTKVLRWGPHGITSEDTSGDGVTTPSRDTPSSKTSSTGGGSKRPKSDNSTGDSEETRLYGTLKRTRN